MQPTSIFRSLASMVGLRMMSGPIDDIKSVVIAGPKTVARGRHGYYVDKTGLPHGSSGSKLARKAARGTVGLRHGRGPHAGMHLIKR